MRNIAKGLGLAATKIGKKANKLILKYPKTSAAVTGAVAWDILDKD